MPFDFTDKFAWIRAFGYLLVFAPLLTFSTAQAQEAPVKPSEPAKREPQQRLSGHASEIYNVVFSPDGKRLASCNNADVRVWDLTTGKELYAYLTRGTNVYGLTFSPDGKRLAVGVSKQMRFLDADTGKELQTITHPAHFVFRMAFSPDGTHWIAASGSSNNVGDVRTWNVATGKEAVLFNGHTESPLNASYSRDGLRVASSSGATLGTRAGQIKVWEAKSGREIQTLRGHIDNVYGVCLSADGKYVASCSGVRGGTNAGSAKLWDVATGKEIFNLEGHTGPVFTIVYSPDGRYLATASADKSVRVWNASTGQEVLNLAHDGIVYAVAFSPDGKRLASGGADKVVRVWELNLPPAANRGDVLTAKQLDALWTDLSGADAGRAYRSVWALAASPKQTLPYLQKRIRPVERLTAQQEKQLAQWLRDLDHDEFSVREKAAENLSSLGEGVLPVLRQTLKDPPSLEVRRQVTQLVATLSEPPAASERLGALRAVDVLESIGTSEAREMLKKVAAGVPEARVTQEAKSALERLARRPEGR